MTKNMESALREDVSRRKRRPKRVIGLPFEHAPREPEAPTPAQLKAAQDLASVLGLTLTEALQRIGYEPAEAGPVGPAHVDMNTRIRRAAGRK